VRAFEYFVERGGTMQIPQRVREYLDSKNVPHEWLHHAQAFTAQEVAHSIHVSGRLLAKTLVLAADGRLIMCVIPASHRLNLPELRALLEVKHLEMLPEEELAKLFPDCELGAIPPLGSLYAMDVWVDLTLSESEDIVFCTGTHVDCVRMKYADFADLVTPQRGRFSDRWGAMAA
jgi:Ala-tRNA(Pro) deacylase